MIGHGLTPDDLDGVMKIIESPLGKMGKPMLQEQLPKGFTDYIRDEIDKEPGKWTVDSILADIRKNSPKMFDVFAALDLDLETVVRVAVESKE